MHTPRHGSQQWPAGCPVERPAMKITLQLNSSQDVVLEYEDKVGRHGMPLNGGFARVTRVVREHKAAGGSDDGFFVGRDKPWLPEYVERRRAAVPKSRISVDLARAKCAGATARLNEYIEQNNMRDFFNLNEGEEIEFKESKYEGGEVVIEDAIGGWEEDHEFVKMYDMQHEIQSRAGRELEEYLRQKNGYSTDRAGKAAADCLDMVKLRGGAIKQYVRRVNEYVATRDSVLREEFVVEHMRTEGANVFFTHELWHAAYNEEHGAGDLNGAEINLGL